MLASASMARATRGAARAGVSQAGGVHNALARATAALLRGAIHRQALACATQAGGAEAATTSAPATRRPASSRAAAASVASARSARVVIAIASAFVVAATRWTARAPAIRATGASTVASHAPLASTAWAVAVGKCCVAGLVAGRRKGEVKFHPAQLPDPSVGVANAKASSRAQ